MNSRQQRDQIMDQLFQSVEPELFKSLMPTLIQLEDQAYLRGRISAKEEIEKAQGSLMSGNQVTPLVLLIDDNQEFLIVQSKLLQQHGYQVITGLSGKDCMSLLQSNKPDVLILDINLMDSNGESIFEYIRHQFETRFLPVIFVSGLISREEIEELNNREDSKRLNKRFLSKPFDVKVLIHTIQDLCRIHRVSGEMPWTPSLPCELDFDRIPVLCEIYMGEELKDHRELTLKARVDEYLNQGFQPGAFEYIVVELLSKGKVRVDMPNCVERLSLTKFDQHMVTAYATELFNRYYPQHVILPKDLFEPDIKKILPKSDLKKTQKIQLKFPIKQA